MPVTDVTTDHDNLTLTITAHFAAPVERVWALYADPRQLEQVWGPPTYPATFVKHELVPGGEVHYFMTSPEGEKFAGLWQVTAVDEPASFTFDDYFADVDFNPMTQAPVSHCTYSFAAVDGGTQAVYLCSYDSAEALQGVLDMGMIEGATAATNQIDAFLAA